MSRRIAKGLELSFHKPSRRWRRVIDGKPVYFGKGNSVDDRKSYLEALTKYVEFSKQREQVTEERNERLASYDRFDAPITTEEIKEAVAQQRAEILEQATSQTCRTLSQLIDLFLDEQRLRNDRRRHLEAQREKGVNVKERKRENISDATLRGNFQMAELIRKWGGSEIVSDSEHCVFVLLKRWRDESDRLLRDDKIAENTFNERMKVMSKLVRWAHANYHLTTLPRNMRELLPRHEYTSSAKSVPIETIRKIFNAATHELKTWICLSLNCGYYAKDISVLRCEDVRDGYIVRARNKTDVPTKFKLWDLTCELLQPYLSKRGSGVIFSSPKGKPLVFENVKTKGRSDVPADRFRYTCDKLEIKGFSYSNLRDTSSTFVRDWDGVEMQNRFLAHVDATEAKRYVDGENLPETQKRLGDLIDRLEMTYALGNDAQAQSRGIAA